MQNKKNFCGGDQPANSLEHECEVPSETIQLRENSPGGWPISRREFVIGATTVAGVSLASDISYSAQAATVDSVKSLPVTFNINGQSKQLSIDPRTSLLDLLREDLKLTGTKKGCDHGQCGACTVLADGRRINSCLALAVSHDGATIITIEGIAKGETLDPVQQAFLDHDGYQCGYCTPGQIISAVALIGEARKGAPSFVTPDLRKSGPIDLTDAEIRERMSGNLCRCGAYPGIVAAVRQAYGTAQATKAFDIPSDGGEFSAAV